MLSSHTNLFAGSPLNRLSWLRTSHPFLNAIIASPATRWLVFRSGQPLVVVKPGHPNHPTLAYLTTVDVSPFLGSEPFFGQAKERGEIAVESGEDKRSPTLAARHHNSPVVFLGVHENANSNALPSSAFTDAETAITNLDGTPYFALDIVELDYSPERLKQTIDAISLSRNRETLEWSEPRSLMTELDMFSGAVYAEARSLVDWNYRNKVNGLLLFSSQSFSSNISSVQVAVREATRCGEAGKLLAPRCSLGQTTRIGSLVLLGACIRIFCRRVSHSEHRRGLHNFTYPRTDPVVIMIAIDETGDKILLGRGV